MAYYINHYHYLILILYIYIHIYIYLWGIGEYFKSSESFDRWRFINTSSTLWAEASYEPAELLNVISILKMLHSGKHLNSKQWPFYLHGITSFPVWRSYFFTRYAMNTGREIDIHGCFSLMKIALCQFARTIDEYHVTMPVPRVRVTSQINCDNNNFKKTVPGDNGDKAIYNYIQIEFLADMYVQDIE